MKGKLVKRSNGRFDLYSIEDKNQINTIASSFDNPIGKLSLKNCQIIELGYDLVELAETFAKNHSIYPTAQDDTEYGFKHGFQKALEIIGDKKFSKEEVMLGWDAGVMSQAICFSNYFGLKREDELKKHRESYQRDLKPSSLQQTEWDVEVEMVKEHIGSGCYKKYPKLDDEGCLILKKYKNG